MLETRIKELTEAVTMLTEAMKNYHPGAFLLSPDNRDALIEAHSEADEIIEQIKVDDLESDLHPDQTEMSFDEEPANDPIEPLTHEDLKLACLASVKADMKNKPLIKAILAEYSAVKAVDVPLDKIGEVIAKIEAL